MVMDKGPNQHSKDAFDERLPENHDEEQPEEQENGLNLDAVNEDDELPVAGTVPFIMLVVLLWYLTLPLT